MGQETLLCTATKSASYNIILQILMRIITFILNAFIIRFVTKDVLGVINVRLVLLYSTIQFLSREAFRRACLSKSQGHCWPQVINILWLTVPLSLLCGIVLSAIWLHIIHQPDPLVVHDYSTGVATIAISVVIEMLAEPLFVVGQVYNFIKLKVLVEGASLTVRSVIMAGLIMSYPQSGIKVFCIGQIFSSTVYTVLYYSYFISYIRRKDKTDGEKLPFSSFIDFLPNLKNDKPYIDLQIAKLTWSFMKQTFLKQILTEGERYVMTLFNALSFAEQGVYDIVNNLGSLAARFVFQPIEESGYIFFAQVVKRGQVAFTQKDSHLSASVLEHLLRLMVLLGLTVVSFGYSYSKLLLLLYGGPTLSTGLGPTLMRWHCLYVVFLAVNGVTECFVFAAMSQYDIDRYNKKMVLLSVGFLCASYYLTSLCGSVGFIIANCFNMAARIAHSVWFIKYFYAGSNFQPLKGLFPHFSILVVYGISFTITLLSEMFYCCDKGPFFWLFHVFVGICCLTAVVITVWVSEKELICFVKQQWKMRRGGGGDKKTD